MSTILRTLTYKLFGKTSSSDPEAKERGIRQDGLRDWRDPDRFLVLDGARVQTDDAAFRSHDRNSSVEPRWDEFDSHLIWNSGTADHAAYSTYNLGRNPPQIFKDALLNGLVLYGVIIARDEQMHN